MRSHVDSVCISVCDCVGFSAYESTVNCERGVHLSWARLSCVRNNYHTHTRKHFFAVVVVAAQSLKCVRV